MKMHDVVYTGVLWHHSNGICDVIAASLVQIIPHVVPLSKTFFYYLIITTQLKYYKQHTQLYSHYTVKYN